jgi:hypothetical protein
MRNFPLHHGSAIVALGGAIECPFDAPWIDRSRLTHRRHERG